MNDIRTRRLEVLSRQAISSLPRSRYARDTGHIVMLASIVLVPLLVLVAVVIPSYFERETVTTRVISKENVCDSSGDGVTCSYLIFTDAGTFEISDAIFGTVRFNSSDVYGRVEEGHTYEITSYGWRLPAFSTYPNIEKIKEVTP